MAKGIEHKADMAPAEAAAGWVRGEPAKDGALYVAIGRLVGCDENSGHSTPFLEYVRWGGTGGWLGWVDQHDMAISSDIEDRVYVDYWIALPPNS